MGAAWKSELVGGRSFFAVAVRSEQEMRRGSRRRAKRWVMLECGGGS